MLYGTPSTNVNLLMQKLVLKNGEIDSSTPVRIVERKCLALAKIPKMYRKIKMRKMLRKVREK